MKIKYSLVVVTNSIIEDKVLKIRHIKDYDSSDEAYKVLKKFNYLFGKIMEDTNQQMAILFDFNPAKVEVIND